MKIAVVADGPRRDSIIPAEFEKGAFLLIFEVETDMVSAYPNTGPDTALARKIVQEDCEAVISGGIGKDAFEVLADAQVTRFNGEGMPADRAMEWMEAMKLDLIRVPRGEVWIPHEHTGECDCGGAEAFS